MKILNFGSCNIDSVYKVSHVVSTGETIAASSVENHPGGKGLNQSIALHRAGAEVYHAGCIGTDGGELYDFMQSCGLNLKYLKKIDNLTGRAFIQVNDEGDNAIVVYSGTNGMVTRDYVDSVLSEFDEGDFLILQNEISEVPYIIDKAASVGMRIVLNPSPFDDRMKGIDLSKITYLILNEIEAAEYAGTADCDEFVSWVRANFPTLRVVLTLGEKGGVYFDKDSSLSYSAFKVEAVDTTAAGDTFCGYFIAGLSKGNSVESAIRYAAAASAIAVSEKGAASSIPAYDAVERELPRMKN